MKTGILLLNFGEPEHATVEAVAPFLERIFVANARLEDADDANAVRRRARELAGRRTPGLIEDYRAIGGSPLNAQAEAQAGVVAAELARRGHDVVVRAAMQFTDPDIPGAVDALRSAGAGAVVGLPVYPLCGPSTTVAALAALREAVDALGWEVPVREIAGWHAHPDYTALRADGVRELCHERGLDLHDGTTRLVFSAHGTPIRYLREGSRYDRYVEDHCRRLAEALGGPAYTLGYQNHGNRPGVEWTEPGIGEALRGIEAGAIVVVPISFMHEQSETLVELDIELREEAEALGLEFHRVPIPHDDPRFAALLADLAAPLLADAAGADAHYAPCRCRPAAGTVCLNRP
jgi:ferrochelatase